MLSLPGKIFPCHKCSLPQFLLIVDNDTHEAMPDMQEEDNSVDMNKPHFLSLSDAAFFGLSSIQTLRVKGFIIGKPVRHNFGGLWQYT